MTTRREKVILELEDRYSKGAAKAAVVTAALKKEIDGLNGTSIGGLDKDIDGVGKSTERTSKKVKEFTLEQAKAEERTNRVRKALRDQAKAAVDVEQGIGRISDEAVRGSKEIDRYSGRLRLLADIAIVLGPAAVVAGAGLAGMGVSAGVAGLALYGLGDALKALNDYQIDPTEAHLKALNDEMRKAGPAGREFVLFLDSLGPKLTDLQMVARAGFLPGLQQGIESLMTRFPEIREIVGELADELGDLAAKGGEWLAGPGFEAFQEFLAYARTQGPAVAEFTRELAVTLIAVGKAMAPVGEVTLPLLTNLLEVLAKIANSPIGPALIAAATAFTIVSRSAQLATIAMGKFGISSEKAAVSLGGIAGKAAGIAGVAMVTGQLADNIGRINSADVGRGLDALALGGDPTKGIRQVVEDIGDITSKWNKVDLGEIFTFGGLAGDSSLDKMADNIEQVDQALANMVESGEGDKAAQIMLQIDQLAGKQGTSIDRVRSQFDAYALALKNAKAAGTDYGNSAAETAIKTGQAEEAAANRARELAERLADQRKAARETARSFTAFTDSLNDSKVSLRDWIQDMADQAAALEHFTQNARTAARRGLREGLIKELQAAGPEGARRMRQLANASDAEIGRANKAWAEGRRAIQQYVNLKVPPKRIDVNGDGAINEIDRVLARLNALRDRTIHITTVTNKIAAGSAGTKLGPHGDFSSGGYTGKGPRFEPAGIVHRGEFVFSSDATRGNERALAMLQKRLRGYAGGGLVDSFGLTPRGRGGRVNQLTGFGDWLSVAEAGTRISNLTAAQIRHLGEEFDDFGKKKLKALGKAFERATDLQERQTDAAKDALERVQSQRADLAGSVTSGLTRNLWETGGSAFSSQFAPGSIGAANAQLRAQIRDSADFARLEGALRNRGVSGAALQEILANGGIDALRMAASASNADLRMYQDLYGRAQTYATRAGTGAGTLVYGAAETRAQANYDREFAQQRAMAASVKAIEKKLDKLASRVGHAAADGVQKGARRAGRR